MEKMFKKWYEDLIDKKGCNAWYCLEELLKSELEFKAYGKKALVKECLEIMKEFLQDGYVEDVKEMIKQLIEILESEEV